MCLAVTLDLAKIVTVSVLYTYWDKLNILSKTYLIPAVIVTVLITSAGSYGYLKSTFQKAVIESNKTEQTVSVLADRLSTIDQELQAINMRVNQIDSQITQMPPDYVKSKIKIMSAFNAEKTMLFKNKEKFMEEKQKITSEMTAAKQDASVSENHIGGPVVAIAELFSVSKEVAIKIISGIIVAVFDPLAILLIICGNHVKKLSDAAKRRASIDQLEKELEEEKLKHEIQHQKQVFTEALEKLRNAEAPTADDAALQNTNTVKQRRTRKRADEPDPVISSETEMYKELDKIFDFSADEIMEDISKNKTESLLNHHTHPRHFTDEHQVSSSSVSNFYKSKEISQ